MADDKCKSSFYCEKFGKKPMDYNVWRFRIMTKLDSLGLTHLTTTESTTITPAIEKAEKQGYQLLVDHLENDILNKYVINGGKVYNILKRMDEVYLTKCPSKGFDLRAQLYELKITSPLQLMFDKFIAITQQIAVHHKPMDLDEQLYCLFAKMPSDYKSTIEVERKAKHSCIESVMLTLTRREVEIKREEPPRVLYSHAESKQSYRKDRHWPKTRGRTRNPEGTRTSYKLPKRIKCSHCNVNGHRANKCRN